MPRGFSWKSDIYVIPAGLDASTTAWIAAVVTNGGSVSAARQTIVNNLIVGLKTDGIWTNLDRLWLFAAENTASALTDLIARSLATEISSPTFAVDRGYTASSSASFVDSNFNASTAPSPKFIQDSGCLIGWNNTALPAGAGPGLCGVNAAGIKTRIFPKYNVTGFYHFGINADSAADTISNGDAGLYVANRTASNSQTLDLNGSLVDNDTNISSTPANGTFIGCAEVAGGGGPYQISCLGFGAGLTGADRTNIYNRFRTYMTAVGVP